MEWQKVSENKKELFKKLIVGSIDWLVTQFENRQVELHKNVVSIIGATGMKIVKKQKLEGQKGAKCYFCIGSNNKYSSICDYIRRYLCKIHLRQT